MNTNRLALLALVCSSLSFSATFGQEVAEGEPPMPDQLVYESFSPMPVFVSAQRAATSNGDLDETYFHAGDLGFLRNFLDQPQGDDECLRIDKFSEADRAPSGHGTLAGAIEESDNVIVARVVGRTFGFSGSTPGTLLRLVTEEALAGTSRDVQYLFFPVGNFRFGDREICSTNPKRPRSAPGLGDRLLVLFDDYWWNDRYDFVRTNGATGAIPLRAEKGVDLPPAFRGEGGDWQGEPGSALVEWARDRLRGKGTP